MSTAIGAGVEAITQPTIAMVLELDTIYVPGNSPNFVTNNNLLFPVLASVFWPLFSPQQCNISELCLNR